jgi:hypothetical protein
MAAGIHDITIEKGARFVMDATYTSNGTTPIDLTGYSGRGQVKASALDATPIASFVVTIPTPANGVVRCVIEADDTELIPTTGTNYAKLTQYYYDIELYTTADADVIRLLNGKASVSPNITEPVA